MVKCMSCLNFSCISTTGNLVFVFIFNTISIAINSYKIQKENFKKKILKGLPFLSKLEIFLNAFSMVNSILVLFTKKCMNRKSINKLITITSRILQLIQILSSIISIFILVKEFVDFEHSNFLNNSNFDCGLSSNEERMKKLKKFDSIPFELRNNLITGEEYFFVEDTSLISYFDYEYEKSHSDNEYNLQFLNDVFYIILYFLEELMNIFSGLNWGSVEMKTKKLVETGLESREEIIDKNSDLNWIMKVFMIVKGAKYTLFSFIYDIFNIVFIIVVFGFNKIDWLNNNISFSIWMFDVFITAFNIIVLVISLIESKKKDANRNEDKNVSACCCCYCQCCNKICGYMKLYFFLFGFLFCFYISILSFYVVYYSYYGKTYFHFCCEGASENCGKLFRTEEEHISYSYYTIFLTKGKLGVFIFAFVLRIITFIWLSMAIIVMLFFANLSGPLEKIVYFIKSSDGSIIDLDDINIVEEIKKIPKKVLTKGIEGNSKANEDDKNNNNKEIKVKEKTVTYLKQVFTKKKLGNNVNIVLSNNNINKNNGIPYNNIIHNNIAYINGNSNNYMRNFQNINHQESNNQNYYFNIDNGNYPSNDMLYFNFGPKK